MIKNIELHQFESSNPHGVDGAAFQQTINQLMDDLGAISILNRSNDQKLLPNAAHLEMTSIWGDKVFDQDQPSSTASYETPASDQQSQPSDQKSPPPSPRPSVITQNEPPPGIR